MRISFWKGRPDRQQVRAMEASLSQVSPNALDCDLFMTYVKRRVQTMVGLRDFYSQARFLNRNHRAHIEDQHFVQSIANALRGIGTGIPGEQQKPVTICFGNGTTTRAPADTPRHLASGS